MTGTPDLDPFPIPSDLRGFWQFDRVHCPRPLTPLSQEVLLGALSHGFTAALDEFAYGGKIVMRAVNCYGYIAMLPLELDGESAADRLVWHERILAAMAPHIGALWQEEWLPTVLHGIEKLRTLDFSMLADARLLETFAELRSDLHGRWRVHGRILFAYVAASAFDDFYRATFAPSDPTESYQLLQGFHTRAVDSSQGLWTLSRVVANSPALNVLFTTTAATKLASALAETDEGHAFQQELDEYLDEFGWRSDAILELAAPTWRESRAMPLRTIQSYLALEPASAPEVRLRQAAATRARLLGRARARLRHDAALLAQFDRLYEQARHCIPIDEDHNFYIDQMGNALMRPPVLELGRRLVRRGVVSNEHDVFLLFMDEVVAGLAGIDQSALAARRQAELDHWAGVTPPPALGEPPPEDQPLDAFITAMIKVDGVPPAVSSRPATLTGAPGAPGTVRGRARVARSLDEASCIEPGEILVCEMTLPPWTPLFSIASAVVADTGGVLSHCAIVAREFGIPCVVGTVVGTTTITDGAILLVNGSSGIVQIEAGS